MNSKNVNIQLTKDEEIVLFEFFGRFNENNDSERFEYQAEERVLWNIKCILEKELSEPFLADYQEIVRKVRKNVRDEKE
ncbi:MAG: hypothetical protein ACSHXG_16030 [Maribacter stanieri]